MLVENTLFGKRDKVQLAIERLRFYEPDEGYYVAYSGGKDSDVVLELAKRAGVRFDAHHNLTTIDPPELVYHVRQHPEVSIDRPAEPLLSLLARKGFPRRQGRWCCELYKERGGIGRVVVTGVRAEESVSRRRRKMVEHCLTNPSRRFLHVIFDWTEADVWEFLRKNNIPYCSLYDEGWKRIGCLFCPIAGKHRQIEAVRYPRYVRTFVKAFCKLYDRRRAEGAPSVNRWANGEEMFWWWMQDHPLDEQDQLMIFE